MAKAESNRTKTALAAPAKPDGAKALDVAFDLEQDVLRIGELACSLKLIGQGCHDDDVVRDGLYGIAHAIENCVAVVEAKRVQIMDLTREADQ